MNNQKLINQTHSMLKWRKQIFIKTERTYMSSSKKIITFIKNLWMNLDWLPGSEYSVSILSRSSVGSGWDETNPGQELLVQAWHEIRSGMRSDLCEMRWNRTEFSWDEMKSNQNEITFLWNEIEIFFMRWNKIKFLWNESFQFCSDSMLKSEWNEILMR